jgi:general secretion pathway protein F
MRYEVKAVLSGQGTVHLELEANSEEEARLQVIEQGGMVLSVKRSFSGFSLKGTTRFPLVHFSQELLSLQTAGLSLVESIETLLEKEQDASNRKIIQTILSRLYEGVTFSQALEDYPQAFPPLYIATIRASERTGDLPEALTRFITYQTQMEFVRKKLVGASIYPVLLLTVGFLVSIFLMVFVVPKFSAIYDDMGSDLPWLSLLLIKWGQFVHERGWELTIATLILIALTGYTVSRPAFRASVMRVPVAHSGDRRAHARVSASAVLQDVGYAAARWHSHHASAGDGERFTPRRIFAPKWRRRPSISAKAERFPALWSIGGTDNGSGQSHAPRVGERTGLMGDMMERIGNFHDEEIARWVEWTTKLIEPLLMAVIGIVIGGIIILMYMPIFELAGSIN